MRLLPPALVLMLIAAMMVLRSVAPGPTIIDYPYNLAGAVLAAVGLLVTAADTGQLARAGTSGLVRWSRNPYAGPVLLVAGVGVLLGTVTPFLAFALSAIAALRWHMAFEGQALRAFVEDYAAYMRGTRR